MKALLEQSASPDLNLSGPTVDAYAHLDPNNLQAYVPRARTVSEYGALRTRFDTEDYPQIKAADLVRDRAKAELAEAHATYEEDMRKFHENHSPLIPSTTMASRRNTLEPVLDESTENNNIPESADEKYPSNAPMTPTAVTLDQSRAFLSGLKARTQSSPYRRPSVRTQEAKDVSASEKEDTNEKSEKDVAEGSGKVTFGMHDTLDFEALTQLRKVFFRPESDSEGSDDEDDKKKPTPIAEEEEEEDDDDDDENGGDVEDGNWESRGLDLDEFIEEFGHIVGANLTRNELQIMFMKIDANSDGDVDWDEFTNWMLKMEAGAHSMNDEKELGELCPLTAQTGENPTLHRNMINRVINLKMPSHTYITAGRDGTIRFWGTGLEHVKTVSVKDSNFHYMKANFGRKSMPGARALIAAGASAKAVGKRLWVTDICHMTLSNRLAVACADRTITFYDLYTMDISCRILNLPHAPSSLCYFVATYGGEQHGVLCFGTQDGHLHTFKVKQSFQFPEGLKENGKPAFPYWEGRSKELEKCGLLEYSCAKVAEDWITKVICVPDIQPNIMTCSLDGTVKFFNVEKNKAERTYPTKTKVATKETTLAPVHSLVYVRASKCMASCGVTRHITTWNPHTCDTMSVLHGHTSPVVALDVDEAGGRLISLSLDKCIKFWDVSSWRCLQSTVDDSNYRPDNYITAMMWDPVMQTLVTAGNRIKVWHHIGRESGEETTSHETPVCAALYNNKFQQVVSCSPENVQVWSIESGQLVFKFDKLHGDEKITTMSFDWSMRRLITGAHDGSVRMWNFSNGMMLKEFLREEGDDDDDEDGDNDDQDKVSTIKSLEKTLSHDNDTEVTSVKYILEQGGGDDIEHKFIVSVGWDKRVRMFVDNDDDIVNPHRILPAPGFSGHNDDILCVVHCEPRLLATGSYDGEIVVWSLASGAGRFFLRLSDYEEFHEDPKEEVGKGGEEVDKVGGELKAFQHLTVDTKLHNGRPSHLHGYSKRDEVAHTELLAAREAHKEKQRIRAEEELLMGAELGSKKGSPKKGTPANSPSRMAQTGGGTPSSQGQHTPTPTKPKEGHASHHGKFGADHRKIIEDKKLQHVLENPKLDPVMYNETMEMVKKGMKHHHHTSAVVDEEEQGGGRRKRQTTTRP
ncbi:hypothetical protein TL16_g07369 [Triparma laevis f. inornata]|uniref:EF-hand domain-containing protein n=1 Tax=Triparma laevis f. inornata TaxID=1714386 RepID=A0A9W7AQH5_9STRA|nr:hypothetical protein TL16_g07369 [Triparma laevis f. inornata]